MRSNAAKGKTKNTALQTGDLVKSLVNRFKIAAKDRSEARERQSAASAGPTVAERQGDLVRFYEKYEDLVEVLCDAAQYGPTSKLENTYAQHRQWFREHYANLKPFLGAYLRYTTEEADFCQEGGSSDAFQALVAPEDLSEFLAADDGSMISRITRTREALNLYGEHLRQLADQLG